MHLLLDTRLLCKNSYATKTSVAKSLVKRIAEGDSSAVEELYQILVIKLRPLFHFRVGGNEADDMLHETLAIVVESIHTNAIRNPNALLSFCQTVARRQVAGWIVASIRRRERLVSIEWADHAPQQEESPESKLLSLERSALLKKGLKTLRRRDSELLTRFYCQGQPYQQICADMGLTETQFRLFKSRAKAKLANWARKGQF